MVVQRGAGVSARKVEKPASAPKGKSAPAAPPPQQKRKLSFKDKHALETLPKEMDGVRAKMASLQTTLDDPGLYNRDPSAFDKVTADLAIAQQKLA